MTPSRLLSALLISLSCSAAQAHPSAHVHGRIQLGVALDGHQLVVDIDTPLDSLVGFEHAPRTPAQKALAADWAARLRAGTGLLRLDPEARCTLEGSALSAPELGLAQGKAAGAAHGHADLAGHWSFRCARPAALRTLDLGFFEASPHARTIEVQWVREGQQGRQTLKRPQSRVRLGAHQ